MTSHSAVKLLLGFVLGLPVVMAVLGWVVRLLTSMEDEAAATVLSHINTATSVLWLVVIVGLVIALAVERVEEPGDE